jgi:hypothetical protein
VAGLGAYTMWNEHIYLAGTLYRSEHIGAADSFTDWVVDFQYDRTIPQFHDDVLSLRGSYIRENASLAATFLGAGAGFPRHHLNTLQGISISPYSTRVSCVSMACRQTMTGPDGTRPAITPSSCSRDLFSERWQNQHRGDAAKIYNRKCWVGRDVTRSVFLFSRVSGQARTPVISSI